MPLIDKDTPGAGETWEELAEHALTHDDLTLHWHLASGGAVAPHVRLRRALKTTAANPLRLRLVACTGLIITEGRHAGRCAKHARRFGWVPGSRD